MSQLSTVLALVNSNSLSYEFIEGRGLSLDLDGLLHLVIQSRIEPIAFGFVVITQGLNQGLEFSCIGGRGLGLTELVQLVCTTAAIICINVNVIEVVLELCKVMAERMVVVLTNVSGIRSCIS